MSQGSLLRWQSFARPSPIPPKDSTQKAFPFQQPQSWLSPRLARMKGISVPPPPKSHPFLLQRKAEDDQGKGKATPSIACHLSPPSCVCFRTGGLEGHIVAPMQLHGELHASPGGEPQSRCGAGRAMLAAPRSRSRHTGVFPINQPALPRQSSSASPGTQPEKGGPSDLQHGSPRDPFCIL